MTWTSYLNPLHYTRLLWDWLQGLADRYLFKYLSQNLVIAVLVVLILPLLLIAKFDSNIIFYCGVSVIAVAYLIIKIFKTRFGTDDDEGSLNSFFGTNMETDPRLPSELSHPRLTYVINKFVEMIWPNLNRFGLRLFESALPWLEHEMCLQGLLGFGNVRSFDVGDEPFYIKQIFYLEDNKFALECGFRSMDAFLVTEINGNPYYNIYNIAISNIKLCLEFTNKVSISLMAVPDMIWDIRISDSLREEETIDIDDLTDRLNRESLQTIKRIKQGLKKPIAEETVLYQWPSA